MASKMFDLSGKVAVVTGGSGVLGGSMAQSLAEAGVRVAVLGRKMDSVKERVSAIRKAGGEAMALTGDVLNAGRMTNVASRVMESWGRVDILINGAGGHVQRARTDGDLTIFDMPIDAFEEVVAVNFMGSVVPTLAFGRVMAEQKSGSIINISSMAAEQAMTGVAGYSAAKAALENFTRWMACEMARKFSPAIRVNAVSPGFFVTHQNRSALVTDDGAYTERSQAVLRRTPMNRFGNPEELNGAVHWLCSDAASFVTGAVVPIDGGFSAFSGI